MSSLRGDLDRREAPLQRFDDRCGVVDGQGRLGEEGKAVRVGDLEAGDVVHGFDERHRPGRNLAEGADDLRMAGVADEQDMAPVGDQPLGLAVDLGDQRTGRIDVGQPAALRLGRNRFRHAMGRKHHRPVVGNLVELVDEDRAHLAQAVDDEAVMDDLVAHIDGRSEPLERELDDLDRPVDARAEAARRRDQHFQRGAVQHSDSHVSLRLQP